MELGLSLGDSSSSKPILDSQKSSSKAPDLGFHMGLTLHSKSNTDDDEDEYIDIDDHSSQETIKDKTAPLHLLSLAPLRFPHQSDNGIFFSLSLTHTHSILQFLFVRFIVFQSYKKFINMFFLCM